MYLDNIKARYCAIYNEPVAGCTIEELAHLQQALNLSFPATYREFLLWVGRDAGAMFDASSEYRHHAVLAMQDSAREIAQASGYPEPLPDDAIVFHSYDDMQFDFIRTSEGDDPTVYFFAETIFYPLIAVEKVYHPTLTFSSWVLSQIVDPEDNK
jgi:hypothetical protein